MLEQLICPTNYRGIQLESQPRQIYLCVLMVTIGYYSKDEHLVFAKTPRAMGKLSQHIQKPLDKQKKCSYIYLYATGSPLQ